MAFALLILFSLVVVAVLALQPLWRSRQRARWRERPLPARWRRVVRRRVPLVARLPADLQLRLKGLMQVFLREKPFIGCRGLVVTEEMRVVVAALACLPLLGHARGYYPSLREVLLYPGPFVVDRSVTDADGVQREERLALSGESWARGQIVLSWPDVLADAAQPEDGHNVVIHECAHQLDQAKGYADGMPPLASEAAVVRWRTTMQAEFNALQHRLERGQDGLLDAYAASDPAEFFAVASECFFECGAMLAAEHPDLYAQLASFYGVDPRSW